MEKNSAQELFEWMNKEFQSTGTVPELETLIMRLDFISGKLPQINEMMALKKRALNDARAKAYQNFHFSSLAQKKTVSPALAKDYIHSKCSQEQLEYDLYERCSRTIVHLIDGLRTSISALKNIQ